MERTKGGPVQDSVRISRVLSTCAVFEAVVNGGAVSRAGIAKQTGRSKQTVSEIVRQLVEDGWIRETGRTRGHVGRSAVTYEIVASAACIASVDLGGTNVRAAIADLSCRIQNEVREETDPAGGMAVVRQISRMCRQAARGHGIDFDRVKLAVVGVPGVPDAATGQVRMAPNLSGFDSLDVRAALARQLGIEVILENDVNLAVLGEHWMGAGAHVDDLVYIKLGTGIGAGIVVGGELVRGATSAAGELGFLPLGADPFQPESRRAGALERVAGAAGIRARYQARTGRVHEVAEILDAATAGDPVAGEVFEETARSIALGVGAICAITNPARVILGGSIGRREDLAARVRALLPQCSPEPVELLAAELDDSAALVGGAAVGLQQLHGVLFADGAPGAEIALPTAEVLAMTGSAR